MDEYPKVTSVFLGLKTPYQKVIADITKRMGAGMAEFIEREVVSLEDWDLYCHYVAGLVGIGLSNLFAGSGLESSAYKRKDAESNHMGLFLQKTNIVRDYLEDIQEEPAPRMFWPRDVWRQYARKLEDFAEPRNRDKAVHCLNHLITNALQHLPHCLSYMEGLRDPMVFRFCAIPQVMAAATLALCYDNGKVFEGVVKMRRGLTAAVMLDIHDMNDLYRAFARYMDVLAAKAALLVQQGADPTAKDALAAAEAARDRCLAKLGGRTPAVVAAAPRWAKTGPFFWCSCAGASDLTFTSPCVQAAASCSPSRLCGDCLGSGAVSGTLVVRRSGSGGEHGRPAAVARDPCDSCLRRVDAEPAGPDRQLICTPRHSWHVTSHPTSRLQLISYNRAGVPCLTFQMLRPNTVQMQ